MKRPRLTAVFSALVAVACGPAESGPPDRDAGTSNDAGETCSGVCAPGAPAGWGGPALFWAGAETDAPHCADVPGAPYQYYIGYANSNEPLCGVCKCDQPIGSCAWPAAVTAAAASCAGDGTGVAHTSFDSPEGWGGLCTAENAIPAGKLCSGVPCVQSVTIAPLTLTQGGCLPIEPPQGPPPTWKTFARACVANPFPQPCDNNLAQVCVAASPRPEFRLCTIKIGAHLQTKCPPGYPDKSIFYENFIPACSPCTCGVPNGASCAGSISLFQDGACGAPLLPSVNLDANGPTCTDVPPGSTLGSKVAADLDYYGGYCIPSGGAPEATVVCCQP